MSVHEWDVLSREWPEAVDDALSEFLVFCDRCETLDSGGPGQVRNRERDLEPHPAASVLNVPPSLTCGKCGGRGYYPTPKGQAVLRFLEMMNRD